MVSRAASAWAAFRDFMDGPTENSVVRFAWAIVGVIAIALILLNWYAISTLAARDWCGQIMSTERYLGPDNRLSSPENIRLIIEGCTDTGRLQLQAVAWVAKALAVALGLIPTAVFVVKFSGASVAGSAKDGTFRMGPGDSAVADRAAHQAAERVAEAADDAADHFPAPEAEDPPLYEPQIIDPDYVPGGKMT